MRTSKFSTEGRALLIWFYGMKSKELCVPSWMELKLSIEACKAKGELHIIFSSRFYYFKHCTSTFEKEPDIQDKQWAIAQHHWLAAELYVDLHPRATVDLLNVLNH